MSISGIPDKIKTSLWVQAGGRCEFEGCNKILHYDLLTKRNANSAYIAHIIADQPTGPRGHEKLSNEKGKDLDNLMLMCDTHHRMIDDRANAEVYTVEVLQKMKKEHEQRIEMLTSLQVDKMSHVLVYTPNVGSNVQRCSLEEAAQAMLPQYYPADKTPIEVNSIGSIYTDDKSEYWSYERDQLRGKFTTQVKPRIESGEIKHLSIFALAPQPLLVELGRLISDIQHAEVYQKHREPTTWKWLEAKQVPEYIIEKPTEVMNKVALNISLSATITNDRITEVLGEDISIWQITIPQVNNDFLKSKVQLAMYRTEMRKLLDEIKAVHGQNTELHVFQASPIATAIELGRVWMPKADMAMVLYDQSKVHGKFINTFTIE